MHQTSDTPEASHVLASHSGQVHQFGPTDRRADLAEQEHGDEARDLRRTVVGQVVELAVRLRSSQEPGQVILELVYRAVRDTPQNASRAERHDRSARRRRRRSN